MSITDPIGWAIDPLNAHVRNSICHMAPADAFHADPEESAEQYVMKTMPREQTAAYRAHLGDCPSCLRAVAEADVFVSAMREASHRLTVKRPAKIKSAC